jgi:hypothetical protein
LVVRYKAPHAALTVLAAPYRYRVTRDAEGWPIIPGRYGRLEWHDEVALAVYSDRLRVLARLWAVPGVRRWHVGDQEARVLVPADRPFEVATLIQARRRRLLTPEAARKRSGLQTEGDFSALGARLAPEAGSR